MFSNKFKLYKYVYRASLSYARYFFEFLLITIFLIAVFTYVRIISVEFRK